MEEDFTIWSKDWQSQSDIPVDLVRRVERETVRMRALRIAETATTALIGGGVIVGAVVHPGLAPVYWWALAAGTWLAIGAAWAISLRSTRGAWEAGAATTAAYVSLQIRRLRQQRQRTGLGMALGASVSAIVLILVQQGLQHALASRGVRVAAGDFTVFWIAGAFVNVVVIFVQFARRRQLQRELTRMIEIGRCLELPDA